MPMVAGAVRLSARFDRWAAAALLIMASIYLVPFVDRGWVPLDEGMVGQAAERVLTGALPHVDYEEPYPGALSYLYAATFKFAGIDLVNLRWMVLAAALLGLWLVYTIVRRELRRTAAALATWIALAWSYPNYFSSLPSWWVLLTTLLCLWALISYIETDRLIFAAIAGLAAGLTIVIKQTGVYLIPPLMMSLLWTGSEPGTRSPHPFRLTTAASSLLAIASVIVVVFIMRSGLAAGEFVYLIVPVAASCAAFVISSGRMSDSQRLNWRALLIASAAASVPVLLLLIPYISSDRIGAFINGVLVLPQRRLQFTSLPMRPPTQMAAAAAAIIWVFLAPRSLTVRERRIAEYARWIVALLLVVLSVRFQLVYMFIWEAARGFAALLPVIALWIVVSGPKVVDYKDERVLFVSSATLAWASLAQFPFASPIYFCYVAPLAVIAGVMVLKQFPEKQRLGDGPTLAIALAFALVCLNRDYVWNMGWFHQVQHLNTPLAVPRATLYVDEREARVYGRVVPLVQQHLGPRGLMAGPDAPEVYFLTGQFSRSGRLFDFFSRGAAVSEAEVFEEWAAADVIVLYHRQRFSPPLPATLTTRLRLEFPKGEFVDSFEVRWR